MGLDKQKGFHRYHRVLSRAVWSSREASPILLELLVEAFVPEGAPPLVVGVDETLERRRGKKKIAAKGIYTATRLDPAPRPLREDQRPQRWVCVALLAAIPSWASRVWALPRSPVYVGPFRALLRGGAGQTAQEEDERVGLGQLLSLVRRWHPEREEIVAVADGGGTRLVKTLPDRCRSLSNPITFITRLRLDAALYEPAPPPRAGRQIGRPRLSRADACPIFLRSP